MIITFTFPRNSFYSMIIFACILFGCQIACSSVYSDDINGRILSVSGDKILYSYESDSLDEYMTYKLSMIELNEHENKLIDSEMLINNALLQGDSVFYAKDNTFLVLNLETLSTDTIIKVSPPDELVGWSMSNNGKILLLTVDYEQEQMKYTIYNNQKSIIYTGHIFFNIMESEDRYPHVDYIDGYFVGLVQSQLFYIDVRKMETCLLSSNCSDFSLTDRSILYYTINAENLLFKEFDFVSNKESDIYANGILSHSPIDLFTTTFSNGQKTPLCIKDNKPFYWIENKWIQADEILFYKSGRLSIGTQKNNTSYNSFKIYR